MKVPAERWIFGRIGRDLSPTGRLGYQTLWASSGLSSANLKELEKVASTFDVARESRLQFFCLEDGRLAITAVRPSRDARTVDRDGRRAFLCFGWIFERAEVSKVKNHPFAVLPPVEELQDVPLLLDALGNPGTAIEPTILPCRTPDPMCPKLPQDVLDLLVMAAYRRGRGSMVDRPIHLLGSPGDCAILLNWIFSRIPPTARLQCTFSTQADQASIPSGRFWAAGRTSREGQRSAFEVALPSGMVRGDTSREKKDPAAQRYGRWLGERKEQRPPSDEELTDVDLVLQALGGEAGVRSSQILDEAFVAELVTFYHQDIVEALVHRLQLLLPGQPGRRAAEALLGEEPPVKVRTTLDFLAQGSRALDRSELRAILEPGWVGLPPPVRWCFKLRFLMHHPPLPIWRQTGFRRSTHE